MEMLFSLMFGNIVEGDACLSRVLKQRDGIPTYLGCRFAHLNCTVFHRFKSWLDEIINVKQECLTWSRRNPETIVKSRNTAFTVQSAYSPWRVGAREFSTFKVSPTWQTLGTNTHFRPRF